MRGPLHPTIAERRDYPFTVLDRRLRELAPAGRRVIAFSAGDPREETPEFIRKALRESVPVMSGYPRVAGKPELRAACAAWVKRTCGVTLDPDTEVLPANGSKEAIFLLALAVLDRGGPRDTIVIPTPSYPVYEASARVVDARVHHVPLASANSRINFISFCQISSFIVAGSYCSRAMSGPRRSKTREPPAPAPATSQRTCGSSPLRTPSSMASAVATLWIATSKFAMNFILVPLPNSPR